MTAAKAAKFLFEMLGCQVEYVTDGDKAINLVKENHRFDAICMDIGLPTVSGTEACLAIREYESQNQLNPIPIVAVTGNYDVEETREYMAAGMQEVIAKPITKEKAQHLLTYCKKYS